MMSIRRWCRTVPVVMFALGGVAALAQQPSAPSESVALRPAWAYPLLGNSNPPAPPNDGVLHQVQGSSLSLTMVQIFDTFKAYDWLPDMHPPMPEVVANGRKPEVRACGMCHYPNGQGRPENASLAGLPAAYILQQLADWKAGLRRSTEPKAGPQVRMTLAAQHVDDADAQAAAHYFASIPYKPWVRVVETDTVPRTQVVIGNMWAAVEGGGTEPIGHRIIEIPENYHAVELRDPRAGFVAYVPPGSIARGERIATTGGGKTQACVSCHGADLKGLGNIPPLAGRSPQSMARQVFDIRSGSRKGPGAALMQPVVAPLNEDDVIDVLAYIASRKP